MNSAAQRTVFFISDGTGITAETLGHSLLAQFPEAGKLRQAWVPFIDSQDKAEECARAIREARGRDGVRPIVFSTLVDPQTVARLHGEDALFIDLFEQFIGPLETELGVAPSHEAGRFHDIASSRSYKARMEAINYTLAHDDGLSNGPDLNEADIVLVGVSRSGKTPTSLYLAIQFGLKAANYPLIPEDFERKRLPGELHQHRRKLFGLTISPERLAQIRQERLPGSHYASLENCRHEIDAARKLMDRENVPHLDSTHTSIEEISAHIMQHLRRYALYLAP
ncbi:MAG: kinase/pyrophosphorylase [Rhodocyclaceae bacterium]|nr:kinase/pyrophosphorylase [Rhodocyclaceae bacterium]